MICNKTPRSSSGIESLWQTVPRKMSADTQKREVDPCVTPLTKVSSVVSIPEMKYKSREEISTRFLWTWQRILRCDTNSTGYERKSMWIDYHHQSGTLGASNDKVKRTAHHTKANISSVHIWQWSIIIYPIENTTKKTDIPHKVYWRALNRQFSWKMYKSQLHEKIDGQPNYTLENEIKSYSGISKGGTHSPHESWQDLKWIPELPKCRLGNLV